MALMQFDPHLRRRYLRLIGWCIGLSAPVAFYLGFSWWTFAHFDDDYKEALKVYVKTFPQDSEGWYALATCSDRVDRVSCILNPDRAALERAIQLEPRPLYLSTTLYGHLDPAGINRFLAHDSSNSFPWLIDSGYRLEQGDVEGAIKAAKTARSLPVYESHRSEAIAIHSRLIRRFYGSGYRADSLLLRQEIAAVSPYQFHNQVSSLVKAEVGRLRMLGEIDQAQSWLEFLFGIGCKANNTQMKGAAAYGLCELLAQRGIEPLISWKQIAESQESGQPVLCGNAYADEDPWIARNSWPGRIFYPESFAGTWLPIWYSLHKSDFQSITQDLGSVHQPPWRRTDKAKASSRNAKALSLAVLVENQGILFKPVRDQATFNRLLDLSPTSDAAILTLLASEWKTAGVTVSDMPSEKLYVLWKLGALSPNSNEMRRDIARLLVKLNSPIYAVDAWRIAAQIDRETFLQAAIPEVSCSRHPLCLEVLREVTGETLGFDNRAWESWWLKNKRQSPQPK